MNASTLAGTPHLDDLPLDALMALAQSFGPEWLRLEPGLLDDAIWRVDWSLHETCAITNGPTQRDALINAIAHMQLERDRRQSPVDGKPEAPSTSCRKRQTGASSQRL